MSDNIIVTENITTRIIEVAPAMTVSPAFNTMYGLVNQAVIDAEEAAETATEQAAIATTQADRAATFVGGNWPLPHSHSSAPLAVDPVFTRLSDAYDASLKRYEYGQRRWGANGTLIEEGTTNLLPAGAENFVTGWTNGTGETCTVTDYPINIPGVGDVVGKRITGNGAGNDVIKRAIALTGQANPHTFACSVWAMLLGTNAKVCVRNGNAGSVSITNTMQRIAPTPTSFVASYEYLAFNTTNPTDILDIVVYAPQIENKPCATSYTPPGTTSAAESLAIPVGATQKNLLTQNQATGGDTLGDTTGFGARANTTVTRDTTELWNGTGSIKFVTAGIAVDEGASCLAGAPTVIGRLYTHSLYIKGTGTINLGDSYEGGGTNTVLTGLWQRITHTFVATRTSLHAPMVSTAVSAQAATFYIDGLQLEEGTTASDWALPEVDYSNVVLNPSAFTLEATIVCPANQSFNSNVIVTHYEGPTAQIFFGIGSTRKVGLQYVKATAGLQYVAGTTTLVPGTTYVVKASAGPSGAKISVNGVIEATSSVPLSPATYTSPLQIGTQQGIGRHLNSYISNLRISKIARTDTEMAYTGKLVADEYTTYYSDCKESISTRPYLVNQSGVVENMLTEVGSRKTNQSIPAGTQLRAVAVAANTIDFSFALPNTMKANPTISGTYTETTSWKLLSLAGVQTTGFTLALLNAGPNQVGFRLTKTSHGLTDATLQFVTAVNLVA